MMNDLTGMEGRKLRMPSVSPLRVMGRVTGRQRGWALGINTIPFHFPATAFPAEMATPRPANLSSVWLSEAMTICDSLLWRVHIRMDPGTSTEAGGGHCCVTDADFCLSRPVGYCGVWGMIDYGQYETDFLHRMYQQVLYTTKVWGWNFLLIRKM